MVVFASHMSLVHAYLSLISMVHANSGCCVHGWPVYEGKWP